MGVLEFLNRLFPPRETETTREVGRNQQCWCGSGRKYKSCHLQADQKKQQSR